MTMPSLRGSRSAVPQRFKPQLVIMLKEPVCGRVKTRLARDIGAVAATAAYRQMLVSLVARLSSNARWRTVLAISPDAAVASRMLPKGVLPVAQGPGDLGQRMQRVFSMLPPGPVVIVGTDIPAVRPADIALAFKAIGRNDAAFGPSGDGGYWLVGFKRRPRVLTAFAGVRWSSAYALADTEFNLSGKSIARLRVLDDVDTAEDFVRQRHLIGRRIAL